MSSGMLFLHVWPKNQIQNYRLKLINILLS